MSERNIYINTLLNTQALAIKENPKYKVPSKISLLRSNHSINPMKKSMWEYYWNKYEKDLSKSITKFRSRSNITQELSNFHFFIKHKIEKIDCFGSRKSKYFNFKSGTSNDLKHYLNNKNITAVCVNDAGVVDFKVYKNIINKIIINKYPNKCKYEL